MANEILDEYKALREELMWNLEQSQKTLTHFLVMVSALIGYGGNIGDALYIFIFKHLIRSRFFSRANFSPFRVATLTVGKEIFYSLASAVMEYPSSCTAQ